MGLLDGHKKLVMGKTPEELIEMGVSLYHVSNWIISAIEKRHPEWHRGIYVNYYHLYMNEPCRFFRALYLYELFKAYPNCFPPFKYPESEWDGL